MNPSDPTQFKSNLHMSEIDALPVQFVAGVVAHVNDDHAADMLLIAHNIAGQTWATQALLQHTDKRGLDLLVRDGDREARVRVPFDAPVEKTSDYRDAVMTLVARAGGDVSAEDDEDDEETGGDGDTSVASVT
jgi:putative heme iron utilization protein